MMTDTKSHKRLATAAAAAILDLSPSTLAKWRSRKKGPPFHKRGRRLVHYYEHEIVEWLASCDLAGRTSMASGDGDEAA
jgi:predicted DNA-binding transcriptional regulator AlpA